MWNFKLSYIRADLIDMTQIHSKIRDHQISEILVIGVMTLLIHTAVHICLGVEYSTLTYSRFITPDVAFSILTSMFGDTDLSPNLLSYENIINYIGGCNIY